jgi:hypothetical protein
MQASAQALDRALPVVAGFITDKTHIPVIRGERASTDGVAIYLPRRSELDLSEADLVTSVAYLYHECGHILHSNFALSASTPLEQAITAVLEDVRIEALVMRRFPAAQRYLSRLVALYVEHGLAGKKSQCFAPVSEQDSEAAILQWYMLYRLRHDVLKQIALAPVLDSAVAAVQRKFPLGMRTRLDALMFEVRRCASEDDVFALAAEIIRMIKEEEAAQEPRQESQSQDEGHDASPGQGHGQDPGPQQSPSPDQGDGQSPGQSQAQAPEAGAPGTQSALAQLLNMGESDVVQSIGTMMADALNASAQARQDRDDAVTMPNVHRVSFPTRPVDMTRIAASINAIRTRTLSWMSRAAEADVQHARAGVHLDFSRLHAARFGGEIFLRKTEGIDLNAAVSILIDRSGSMCSTIALAAEAALATMLAFDVPGIQTQVSVFPMVCGRDEGVAVLKGWQERPRHLAGRVAALNAEGGTPMSEAILWALADILRRQESFRVLMVVTDGAPNNTVSARRVIALARSQGIAVLGLGIGVDPSSVFKARYSASVTSATGLARPMVALIKAAMADLRDAA